MNGDGFTTLHEIADITGRGMRTVYKYARCVVMTKNGVKVFLNKQQKQKLIALINEKKAVTKAQTEVENEQKTSLAWKAEALAVIENYEAILNDPLRMAAISSPLESKALFKLRIKTLRAQYGIRKHARK